MQKHTFQNQSGQQVFYLHWPVDDPLCAVVIAHGMVEHPRRYADLARFLNKNAIAVYGIYHIGHGEDAQILNHMGPGEFDTCISNIHQLVSIAGAETGKPVVLLGHSMGSFMSQIYITRYDDLAGVILSGSTKTPPIAKAGALAAKILYAFSPHKTRPSKLMNTLAFGAYNNAFPNPRTDFDWLSRDDSQVDAYVDDPLCGGICSIGFFKNLTGAMASMGKEKFTKNINKDLPIYIQGGGMDPVSDMGKGLTALKAQYDGLGIRRVELDIYPEDRHEIFNELDKETVYRNTLQFLLSLFS